MNMNGKVYRSISLVYFILHCILFAITLIGYFLPNHNRECLFEVLNAVWIMNFVVILSSACSCYFAWRSNKNPLFCVASFLLDLFECALLFCSFMLAGLLPSNNAFDTELLAAFHSSFNVLFSGLLIIPVDALFLIYSIVVVVLKCRPVNTDTK